MKQVFWVAVILISTTAFANAQGVFKGTVYEQGTNIRLSDVFIRDINNRQVSITDNKGNFAIRAAAGQTLIFNSPGYTSDTLYLIDLTPKKIMLTTQTISLRQVNITAKRTPFNPRAEYPEVYEKSKVYVFSPSTWFSSEGKKARRLKRYFQREAEQRGIDAAFSPAYVSSLVPLRGTDLENFMTMFRPTYAFIRSNNAESMVAYVNDSYKKFMALPPDKRAPQPLKP
ncbi:carboxypeptidase-like regulatory domain-containing protein [Mucilaginibacter sp. 14171R-50]|uniref:carboxypeptidase-like regulatory domain-containing protein n=1 Tax=Mucilaginibacter sp. 14171R-50 TaxID=2703789 RepID=UPI00138B21F0|nr:carboxypeptidase-like regulatory domain-containing protein [Mucilaginibacter sp. 14171R-50]QHS54300.1 carboxypeptidase-like regulatory domain-containing protein [Mucilaginibacter sp. 14171R-50]